MVKEGVIVAELDVKKQVKNKPSIKRIEIEYKDMNYIIINLVEHVIDVNGELWEYSIDDDTNKKIMDIVWDYEDIDEFDYWPDKSNEHAPLSPMWRLAWYDEYDTYYHKSGATKYPEHFLELIDMLKELK